MENKDKELEFAEILSGLKKIALKQGKRLSSKQLKEAFSSLELDEAQLEQIEGYFAAKGIGITDAESPAASFSYRAEGIDDDELEELFERILKGEKRAKDIFIEAHVFLL